MKYYLIGFDHKGSSRLGSSFTHIIDLKTIRGARNRAILMQKACKDIKEVYRISEAQYTQKVCEMGKEQFEEYVKRVGVKLI